MGLDPKRGFDLFHKFPSGPKNLITDVPGVRVGHVTRENGDVHTGVTAILPHPGNIFREKVPAAAEVINGFGKSIGLVQIRELGCIETPIVMTNTLNVGTAWSALCKYMLDQNSDIGTDTGTVNCVVTECNDGNLNDIRGMHVTTEDVLNALNRADVDFEEGCVGSGTGMRCLGLKGGIGSASKVVTLAGQSYTIGALTMTNFGAAGNLVIGGKHYDTSVLPRTVCETRDKGSIIMILATDIPLSSRQLGRVARRLPIALGRTGSTMGHGSGDICLAFSTADKIPHYSAADIISFRAIHEDMIDDVFTAAIEAMEESIISSLDHAVTTVGRAGNIAYSLRDFLENRY